MDRRQLNLELYKKLYLIRTAENAIRRDYMTDAMKTPMHMSAGEEAICAGVCQALAPSDQVLGTYRSHGLYLAKTGETDRFFAEMYGKSAGMAKGKGGSMHLTAPDEGLICTSAIVATTIPVAIGAAFANKSSANGRMVAAFFGDGAVDEGAFWESLNCACSMKLPIIFVCEDNGYAVHSPSAQRHGYNTIADVAAQLHCDVFRGETTDAEVIHGLATKALDSVRSLGRPAFLHLKYYRYLEHVGVSEDFEQGYRERSEYESWKKADPIALMRGRLREWMHEQEIVALEATVDSQVDESVRKAIAAPFPPSSELYKDVVA